MADKPVKKRTKKEQIDPEIKEKHGDKAEQWQKLFQKLSERLK